MRGSCLCGGIRFEVVGPTSGVSFCHCSLCRRASGGTAFGHVLVRAEDLRWESGEALLQRYERASGYGVVFCRVCGSPAPDPVFGGTRYRLPVGLLDGDLQVTERIFTDSAAAWETLPDDGPRFGGDGPPRTDLP